MPISANFDGYVVEDPQEKEGEYGKYADIILKVTLGGREVHYVYGRFYGRKIKLILDFVHGGEYMTMTGSVSRITPKVRKDGIKCCCIYLRDAFFTLPPKMAAAAAFNVDLPNAYTLDQPLDSGSLNGDNELSL